MTHFLRFQVVWILSLYSTGLAAADWPQFMRSGARAGDAAEEGLRLPLRLATCVRLDDAVTTAPAVVGGKVYIVDQMGTAYCIDPKANRILWKSSPDGRSAKGGNTSSVCVYQGHVCFGTTAGRFHVLNALDGKVIKIDNAFDDERILARHLVASWSLGFASVKRNESVSVRLTVDVHGQCRHCDADFTCNIFVPSTLLCE